MDWLKYDNDFEIATDSEEPNFNTTILIWRWKFSILFLSNMDKESGSYQATPDVFSRLCVEDALYIPIELDNIYISNRWI